MSVRAVVVDHEAPGGVRLGEVPDPVPTPGQALVAVRAVSVNPGEISHRIPSAADGDVPGWETAGVVVAAATDGSGPPVGTSVITFDEGGGWAELRAVDTDLLGTVSPTVDLAQAATLPIAAGSALRALRALGAVIGTRLLVVGATGAVGRFAVQLGVATGATVVAVARDTTRHDELRELGASDVLGSAADLDASVVNVIDTVGGDQLVHAFRALSAGGTLVSVGRSSGTASTFTPDDLIADHGRSGITLRTFFLGENLTGLAEDWTWLAEQLRLGRLQTDITETVTLDELPDRLLEPVRGKLVALVG